MIMIFVMPSNSTINHHDERRQRIKERYWGMLTLGQMRDW